MTPLHCKRLIEVDFPTAVVSRTGGLGVLKRCFSLVRRELSSHTPKPLSPIVGTPLPHPG